MAYLSNSVNGKIVAGVLATFNGLLYAYYMYIDTPDESKNESENARQNERSWEKFSRVKSRLGLTEK